MFVFLNLRNTPTQHRGHDPHKNESKRGDSHIVKIIAEGRRCGQSRILDAHTPCFQWAIDHVSATGPARRSGKPPANTVSHPSILSHSCTLSLDRSIHTRQRVTDLRLLHMGRSHVLPRLLGELRLHDALEPLLGGLGFRS